MLKLPKLGNLIQYFSFSTTVTGNTITVKIDFSQSSLKYSKASFELFTDTNYPQTVTIVDTINTLLNAAKKNNIKFSYFETRSYMEFNCSNSVINTSNTRFSCNSYSIS